MNRFLTPRAAHADLMGPQVLQRLGGPLCQQLNSPLIALTATTATTTSGVPKAQEARPHPTRIA